MTQRQIISHGRQYSKQKNPQGYVLSNRKQGQ